MSDAGYAPCILSGTMTRPRSRVLIVDDPDGRLSRGLRPALALHEVDVAHDAFDTIYRIDCAHPLYDLIFCDLARGDVPGPELWAYLSLRRRDAAERMVFVASGPLEANARAFLAGVPNARVELPLRPDTLDALARAFAVRRLSARPTRVTSRSPKAERKPA